MFKITQIWRASAVAALALTTGLAPVSAAEDPVRLVVIGGFTGYMAQNMGHVKVGADAAVSDLNARGGILGRPVELITLDSGGDPTKTVSLFQQYVSSNDKPDLVLPGNTSNEALALAPLFTRQKVMSFGVGAHHSLDDPASYPYHFGIAVSSARLQEALPAELDRLGVKRLAIVTPLDAYGSSIVTGVTNAVTPHGIEATAYQFDTKDLDISGIFDRAIADKPDAFYFEGTGEVAQRMVRARVEVNATEIPTILGNAAGVDSNRDVDWGNSKAMDNVRVQTTYVTGYAEPAEYSEAQKRFFDHADKAAMERGVPIVAPAFYFDMIQLYAKAVETAGTTDPDAVKAALESPDFPAPVLLSWSNFGGYSPERHFPNPPLEDFRFINPAKMVMGMMKSVDP